jgi:triphosphoribosyl-dephospho-CoA synthase
VSQLTQLACHAEVTARKVGNVHRSADFVGTTYLDFARSANLVAEQFREAEGCSVGSLVNRAVRATVEALGQNTNLGIILLLAPLVRVGPEVPLREGVLAVLNRLTVEDAALVYEAIRIAKPGGLGHASEQDVHEQPTVTLLEAMQLAADRDLVARQYANGFADVFDFGVPTFVAGVEKFNSVEAAIIDLQLRWLAREPDTLIARKNGDEVAGWVQEQARNVLSLGGIETADGRRAGVQLDRELRRDGNKLNPGATADVIAACLFAALRENKVTPSAPFPWQTDDWL